MNPETFTVQLDYIPDHKLALTAPLMTRKVLLWS